LTNEAETERMIAWLSQPNSGLAVSDWVITELSAALSVKVRMGLISPQYRDAALATFNTMLVESVDVLAITTHHFRSAAALANRHSTGLRAADALHLAIADDAKARLVTLDRRIAQAGQMLGLDVVAI
jgi:predicted nucleic acid-binding protein